MAVVEDRAAMLAMKKQRDEGVAMLGRQDWRGAEPHLRAALQQARDQKNSETYMWMQRLAQSLIGKGGHASNTEAAELLLEAENGFRRFGPEDEDLLDCRLLHAECLFNMNKFSAADDVARPTLAGLEENKSSRRGADHPTTLKCRGLLAQILNSMGRTKDAKALAQSNLEILEAVAIKTEATESIGSRRLAHSERYAIARATASCEKVLGTYVEKVPTPLRTDTMDKLKPKRTDTIDSVSTKEPSSEYDQSSRMSSKASAVTQA